ncbi:hypothetical protein A6R68_16487 [Neotoma lepida]|uniref:GTP-binding nuclear protein Ran n=1 Tax=Neotoma lepida TaxID=56216 RepID=A0A1A6HER9_NEOLE|nr:hypothetical protein A6R68_16487 [Neotoma lepida]
MGKLEKFVATLGMEMYPLTLHTNKGPTRFNMWNTAGQEKFGSLYLSPTCHRDLRYDIKSNYNFVKPFLWLARKLTGDPN